uniref:Uncharacterized protein n=1 Tax=Apteryx owenii TaxID=8824 RepID=A0A8B9QJJ8_APTOW
MVTLLKCVTHYVFCECATAASLTYLLFCYSLSAQRGLCAQEPPVTEMLGAWRFPQHRYDHQHPACSRCFCTTAPFLYSLLLGCSAPSPSAGPLRCIPQRTLPKSRRVSTYLSRVGAGSHGRVCAPFALEPQELHTAQSSRRTNVENYSTHELQCSLTIFL